MTAKDVISQFTFNQFTIMKLLDGINHEQSLQSPPNAGNCLNWVLGHLVFNRSFMLSKMLGGEPLVGKDDLAAYSWGAKNFDPTAATSMDELKKIMESSFEPLKAALEKSAATFETPAADKFIQDGETNGDHVGYMACHEAYHIGQVGILRRMYGKPGLF